MNRRNSETSRIGRIGAIGSLALATMVAGTVVGYGCGDDAPTTPGNPDAATTPTPDAAGTVATYSHLVTSTLVVGPTSTSNALDIDGDGQPDNRLGGVLVGLKILAGFDVDATLATAVTQGQIVILHSLKASDMTTASTATWQVYIGDPKAEPDLTSGHGMFSIAAASPTTAILPGSITAGTFTGGPATVSLNLALVVGADPLSVTLHGAKIAADLTPTGCTHGKLDGGITQDDLVNDVIPALAAALNVRIAADGTCATNFDSCSPSNQQLLTFIDRNADSGNSDNHIQPEEITNNATIAALLVPDVDLLDASNHDGHDGTKESLSIAVGFECAKAVFTAPSEQ